MQSSEFLRHIDYAVVVWRCASHQINLIVAVAIVGELVSDPLDTCDVCAAFSRLYKHLIPMYVEGFAHMLNKHLMDTLA